MSTQNLRCMIMLVFACIWNPACKERDRSDEINYVYGCICMFVFATGWREDVVNQCFEFDKLLAFWLMLSFQMRVFSETKNTILREITHLNTAKWTISILLQWALPFSENEAVVCSPSVSVELSGLQCSARLRPSSSSNSGKHSVSSFGEWFSSNSEHSKGETSCCFPCIKKSEWLIAF